MGRSVFRHSRIDEQLFSRNVKRFPGGLVFKAHRPVHHSTPCSRVIKKKECARGLGDKKKGLGFEDQRKGKGVGEAEGPCIGGASSRAISGETQV